MSLRKRKRRFMAFAIALLVLFFCGLYYLSFCTEVSYMVQFTSVNKEGTETRVISGNRFMGAFPNPPDLLRPCKPNESACICASENPIEAEISKCEVIHVSIICAGFESSRRVSTLIKSLLFHRKNPIHLHLVVDENVSKIILSHLFLTWNLPAVQVSFHSVDSVKDYVSWIPNRHYSGIFGLLKLTLPKILPQDLEKVLVIDTDILFVSDVSELWREWKVMAKQRKIIGLVENQSNWYLGKLWKNHQPWPALGRGFNTGVILMNLEKLRELEWMNLWKEIAERELKDLRSTALADQDIFNAVIKKQPELVYNLDCSFNLQLGDHTNVELCQSDISDLKIVHWNSPHKVNVKNKYASFFKRHYQTFLEMDGNLLRRELLRCPNVTGVENTGSAAGDTRSGGDSEEDYDEDDCYEFRRAHKLSYRTHLFFSEFQYTPKAADVTLVAQLSMDRLQMIVGLLEHWDGPASIAVYVSDAEAYQLNTFLQESTVLSRRKDVAYHVVYKEGTFYPVNYLRNVALRNVLTEYVYLSDIDFLPMYGLYEVLRQSVVSQGNMDRKALVVPAFETQRYRFQYPKSKAELVNMLDTGQLFVFRQDVWAKGHIATDYDKWRTATAPYSVGWQPDFEPYVVVSRNVPLYDTRFLGFGWNKSSFIMELDALGYDFVVLPSAFMIHLPHSPSIDILKYRGSLQYRRCLKILKGEFIKALSKKYNRRVQIANNTRALV